MYLTEVRVSIGVNSEERELCVCGCVWEQFISALIDVLQLKEALDAHFKRNYISLENNDYTERYSLIDAVMHADILICKVFFLYYM